MKAQHSAVGLIGALALWALLPLAEAQTAMAQTTMTQTHQTQHKLQEIRIEIPVGVLGQVEARQMIPAAFLAVLAQVTKRPMLSPTAEAEIVYGEDGEPQARLQHFGDKAYGLAMHATPIASGQGVHGEQGTWRFYGLPPGLHLAGSHRAQYRHEDNYIALTYQSADPAVGELLKAWFGREIMTLISYDRAH
ncbi:MAG: hypothetical protein CVV27_02335 [Candidatus Melainabacteria bacterium HGW-Melainabacteria-1]|nr:MAG: hypothetical protein CVV27_02335 [Candidatus Melainabacteria bacterium HGW-Melainabacteria-1]